MLTTEAEFLAQGHAKDLYSFSTLLIIDDDVNNKNDDGRTGKNNSHKPNISEEEEKE